MEDSAHRAIAIVGVGAVLPDAVNAAAFWQNVKNGTYSVTEVQPDRWDPALYWDPDPNAPDKTYSRIGGWVREHTWDPLSWHLPVPPRVCEGMDEAQKWAVSCAKEALDDYGYPARLLDTDRTAVIFGNAMAGEKHYLTSLRLFFPEFERELESVAEFSSLPATLRREITSKVAARMKSRLPAVTEDTMPGELANCMAGRVANLFNLRGPNYVADAACASAMAAISAAVEGLVEHDYDAAVAGGIDRNMGAPTFIKFCKIGALSATGTRPYADGADGFVMGEGAALFILKRLSDAEQNGDKIYAVLRGMAGSSDGKGKGITAPNPIGQKLCLERAWQKAGLSPATATMIEGHGTSTRVGDVVEVNGLAEVLRPFNLARGSVALGSVKSNIGHLKGAAGAAGLLKAALALHEKVLPPSVHCERPNPGIDFASTPLYVNGELRPWTHVVDGVRRAGVSAFGFGGTNFHAVLEEYIPGRLTTDRKHSVAVSVNPPAKMSNGSAGIASGRDASRSTELKPPMRGALVLGGDSKQALVLRLQSVQQDAAAGRAPAPAPPVQSDLKAAERIAIDYGDASELADRAGKALKALAADQLPVWKALRSQGIFRGSGAPGKVAFLYTGQGSQYVNMLKSLRATEPLVADTFAEADRVMAPLLGRPLSDFIFIDANDPAAVSKLEADLRQTAITQPAVLATDAALTRLLLAYGVEPDMTMGHSLGEYGALVAAGGMRFDEALEAVSARGREMTRVSLTKNGKMAAVFAPVREIEKILSAIDGYAVIANVNSNSQAVIGGETAAVERAVEACVKAGFNAVPLEVSHAFHTSLVAPASAPLRQVLERIELTSPRVPIVANLNGEFYPTGPNAPAQMIDILSAQVAAPVQFVKGLQTLYDSGARIFVEVGPKKALQGFAEDVLGAKGDVLALYTNHPKVEDVVAFNQALCGLYAAGVGASVAPSAAAVGDTGTAVPMAVHSGAPQSTPAAPAGTLSEDKYVALGHLLADFLDRSRELYQGGGGRPGPSGHRVRADVTITGAALGLPGGERIFDEHNIARILAGEQFIGPIPGALRSAILDKKITRLVKSENGGPVFETIEKAADVIKLAGRGGAFDVESEFGIPKDRLAALDRVTQLAMAVGIDALRDAGIPLVMHYKTTSKGTRLPERWGLPDSMRDDTGIVFASCWPGSDSLVDAVKRHHEDKSRREKLALLEELQVSTGGSTTVVALEPQIRKLRAEIDANAFSLDRRFLFRTLAMGHSQLAELIGARGPNTQINSACASTTQAVAIAEDWIREGRCRRVIVVSADDVTSNNLMEWIGAGFLATGAAATDEDVREAALPFDRRRHGTILGMGAAGLVVERADSARERGLRPVCQVLSTMTANSAFHGTRLDVQHICSVMEHLVSEAESRCGVSRSEMARKMVFVSHETYTPARGGSAAAEIEALRSVFGPEADAIVIANTKGFTGHAMGAGIEDVVAVKCLESGCIPPVANYRDVDPELGNLNLSKGGSHPVEFALRLGAGFGSQISMSLLRWVGNSTGQRPGPEALGYQTRIVDANAWSGWLCRISNESAPEVEVVQHTLRVKDGKIGQSLAALTTHARPEPAPEVSAHAVAAPTFQAALLTDAVRNGVLAIIAEKTGYPPDMLALDLDLEADLGVDTVKQAEVFASVRERWNIPRDESLKLRDFPTLNHVIAFVKSRRPDLASVPEPVNALAFPVATAARGVETESVDGVREQVLDLVCEKTGYPRDMLALDLDLEADLGVDTVKQAELFAAIRSIYGIAREENLRLRDFPTLNHVIGFVHAKRPDLTRPTVATSTGADPVTERVLALVCEKTGYPKDMLDLDLDLEADLGVDTVKQAELFAAIRGIYGIAREESLKLRDFPTLRHVIGFVRSKRPDLEAAAPTPATTAAADPIVATVLAIVARQTGYATEMLDLELDLESDLGIDTVKQAEMFASVRNAFNIPRDQNLRLRDFPTLNHVIAFARERQITSPAVSVVPESVPESRAAGAPSLATFDAVRQIPRRVPVPALRPALDRCKLTGVELGAGTRVIVAPDTGGVAEALTAELQDVGVQVLTLTPNTELDSLLDGKPVQGVYWLPGLDDEGTLEDLSWEDWKAAIDTRIKRLYRTMRALYDTFAQSGTFLVAAVRLDGQHGYNAEGATAPMGGSVTGFTKTFKRERPNALVKAVDFEQTAKVPEVAAALIAETLRDTGAVEIGYRSGQRWTVAMREQTPEESGAAMSLNRDSVFVVTGAAGSIVSAITADLAAASAGTFYLLDLVAEPDPTNGDLQRFDTDRERLKRDLAARLQARGERPTPVLIERELAALERSKAALEAIDAVRAAGGTPHYISLDLRNGDAVAAAIDQIRSNSGRIDVLLHAAGVERSHALPDKHQNEFDLVFDVKADGWFHMLKAIGEMPVGATVVFSSIAARFGNSGQADYASANDLLCKMTSNFRKTHPDRRGIAIDWTAWGGIGMATRGSIPKVMEAAGIDMLPPEAGIPFIRRELTAGGGRGEVVVAQRLGMLMDELDSTGGLDTAALPGTGPMTERIAAWSVHDGICFETTLDPRQQPFLNDHRIDGTAVLPGVMGLEAFAEAAACALPGWNIVALENVEFMAPFKFYRDEPRVITVEARPYGEGEEIVADCRLTGSRSIAAQSEPQKTTHFTARVRLSKRTAAPITDCVPPASAVLAHQQGIYSMYFHGPAYQVLDKVWRDGGEVQGLMAPNLPADHLAADPPPMIAPRLIELCFQTAGIAELVTHARMGLPSRVDQIRLHSFPVTGEAPYRSIVSPGSEPGSYDAKVLDASQSVCLEVKGYRTITLSEAVDTTPLRATAAAAIV